MTDKNLFTYNRAVELLFDRFPSIGFMVNSWNEAHVPEEPVSEIEIGKAEILYFYGLGTGGVYLECKKWLQENPERQLVILEDEPGVIASFLHRPEAIDILSDSQVHLEFFSKTDEEIAALANRFSLKRVAVAGLKSKAGLEALRLNILRKTTLSYALHIDRLHGYQPFENFCKNLQILPHSFYANRLKGKFKNVPAIVCGAGPSLANTLSTLKKMENRALIIAGGSTLAALSMEGIRPHFGMAIDPNLEEYRRFKNSFQFEVPLLYSTRVHPGIFQTCNGPFGYMRSGIGGVPELWVEEELELTDSLIGENLSDETVSVTGICLAFAVEMGCNPILINGVDLAYTNNQHYAPGVVNHQGVEFEAIDLEKSAADQILIRNDQKGNPVHTAVRWVMESASISEYAKAHPEVTFINTTEGGIGFEDIHYTPIEEATQEFKEEDLRRRVFQAIDQAKMPQKTQEIIYEKLNELRNSLKRSIEHLHILTKAKKGSLALAEMDLKEEIATLYLFYDITQVLKPGEDFWEKWLELALKYEAVLIQYS